NNQRNDTRSDNRQEQKSADKQVKSKQSMTAKQKKDVVDMLEQLVGTHGAFILDDKFGILGKVPKAELESTLKSMGKSAFAIVIDGSVDKQVVDYAENHKLQYVIGMDAKVKNTKITVLTADQLA
ncbi:MAG: hypothetical protein ACMXYC_05070, partial [Candidatus Woesearchaeota archaeon]